MAGQQSQETWSSKRKSWLLCDVSQLGFSICILFSCYYFLKITSLIVLVFHKMASPYKLEKDAQFLLLATKQQSNIKFWKIFVAIWQDQFTLMTHLQQSKNVEVVTNYQIYVKMLPNNIPPGISGRGSVGRAVASKTKDLQLESSHWQIWKA